MKNKLLILAMGFALTTQLVMAQVPSYVPTNGLVGYWPFNGNANDESGNGNNGVVNGATLTTDRNGIDNNTYSFDGLTNEILVSDNSNLDQLSLAPFTLSFWFNGGPNSGNNFDGLISRGWSNSDTFFGFQVGRVGNQYLFQTKGPDCGGNIATLNPGTWHHVIQVYALINCYINNYVDGVFVGSINSCSTNISIANNNFNLKFGVEREGNLHFQGKLDDIGIWNRALTQQEITNLYNSAYSSDCLTMVINSGPLSTNPVTYASTVNIYPNPANDQITIDCGNLANVSGWSIKITNMLGQEVFNQPMNTQQYVVPLNSWTGQGMYFVKIINAQNEVVNIKKIILQ